MTTLSKWLSKYHCSSIVIAWCGTTLLILVLLTQSFFLLHSLLFQPIADTRLVKSDDKCSLPKVNLSQIRDQEFFGSEEQQIQDDEPEMYDEDSLFNAPEFKGKSRLVGIISSSEPSRSLAIVDYNQQQQSYSLDDKIGEHDAMVLHIFPDRIAIKSQGNYYTLRLSE